MCKDKQAFIRTLSTRFILNGGVLMRYNVEKKMTWPWIKIIVSKRLSLFMFMFKFSGICVSLIFGCVRPR